MAETQVAKKRMVVPAPEAEQQAQPGIDRTGQRNPLATFLTLLLVLAGTMLAVWGGPPLGDHEALVAQCGRDMRMTNNWLVPHYLGEPYVRKPPLPYWLIAGLSYVLPHESRTGLPVDTTTARLPSALAAFGTVLLLWKLASVMFSPRVGRIAAVVAASSVMFMLYAPNATVEMLLTFCCVWAHAHFWMAIHRPLGSWARRLHLFGFYVAMGLGMMAKGPFPLAMVAFPVAAWWYTQEGLQIIAADGVRAWRAALANTLAGLWPRTVRAFRELWLVPGLIVFALCFVPWMVAVGMRHPHAWDLWNWQYLQRAQGDYDDTRPRGVFYYVPVVAGLVFPWLFAVFEGAAAPWIRKFAEHRRALLYAGLWALLGTLVMSLMEFKKPYYVVPAVPGLLLLLAVVLERFYTTPIGNQRLAWMLWYGLIVGGVTVLVAGYFPLREDWPLAVNVLMPVAAGAVLLLIVAGWQYIHGRPWTAFGMTACTSVLAFLAVWYGCAGRFESLDKIEALDHVLAETGVTNDDAVYWVSRRPDSRLSFYHNRITQQMIQPAEVVEKFPDRTQNEEDIQMMVMDRAGELLAGGEAVYLILDRDELQLARIFGMGDKAREIGCAPDPDQSDSDWMVVTNRPGAKP